MKKLFIRICFILLFSLGFSQEFKYKSFGVNEGLPSSQVYHIFQDKKGNLWFATDRGIAKYNGYEFQTFEDKMGDLSLVVTDFYHQDNGQIWCSTINNEIFRFNDDFTGFIYYPYNDRLLQFFEKTKSISYIESIKLDAHENMHIAFMKGNYIHRINISKAGVLTEVIDHYTTYRNPPRTYFINCAFESSKEPFFYISNTKQENSYSTETKHSLLQAAYSKASKLSYYIIDHNVHVVNKDGETVKIIKRDYHALSINALDDQRIIIGYFFGGCIIVDAYGNIQEELLEGKSVTNGYIDHAGGLWISTHHSGVKYVENTNLRVLNIPREINSTIHSLSKTNKEDLLIGTDNGYGFRYTKDNKFEPFFKSQHLSYPTTIQSYHQDTIYVGAYGIHKIYNDQTVTLFPNVIKNLPEYFDKNIMGSNDRQVLLRNLDTVNFNFNFKIQDAITWNNNIYIATDSGTFKVSKNRQLKQIIKERANDIEVNPWNNKFYAGTLGKGLKILNKDKIINITTEDGIYNNFINEIYIENEHTIWLATNGGLNRLVLNDKDAIEQITGFNEEKGLIDNEVRDIEIINDTLWIATKGGLVYTNKTLLEAPYKGDNHFQRFKEITVNDNAASSYDLNSLSYKENYLSFAIEGISFKEDLHLTYHYFLEGLDKNWQQTKSRMLRFSALQPGKYTLYVTTCKNLNKCENHIIEQSFIIAPPFWKTWWFIGLSILFLSTAIYLFFKIQILTYNKGVAYELIRLLIKRINKKEHFLVFREAGQDVKIKSGEVLYVESSGNYISVYTKERNYTIRLNISKFISITSDPMEYVRIHRKYIVRIDKVISKSKNKITLENNQELPVGGIYIKDLDRIITF